MCVCGGGGGGGGGRGGKCVSVDVCGYVERSREVSYLKETTYLINTQIHIPFNKQTYLPGDIKRASSSTCLCDVIRNWHCAVV